MNNHFSLFKTALSVGLVAYACLLPAKATALDENCVVNILNRTVQVSPDGSWSLPNVPSNQGRIRARATCQDAETSETVSGESEFFNVTNNGITEVSDIVFDAERQLPSSLSFFTFGDISLSEIGATRPLSVIATYPDDSEENVTMASTGINYRSSNPATVTVDEDGLITAVSNGRVLITASKDGLVAIKTVIVSAGGDADGDGLPDDYETANGLNPNDPVDALEDVDGDGLSALEEFNLGTNPNLADSDRDGIDDQEETVEGEDGVITNPLLTDTDGDGINDGVELVTGTDPNDASDVDYSAALDSLSVAPEAVVLTFNAINTEASTQLTVTGHLIDGTTIDLTSSETGTTYLSSDLTIASFGLTDGEIFAGAEGEAVLTISNNSLEIDVSVLVEGFTPVALASLDIPGYANNVDVAGNYAFVAAGAAGLQVVDVTDRANPTIVGSYDTQGTAIDIKVVGNNAYIADGEQGLVIIDIADPTMPVLVGGLDTAGIAQDLVVDLLYAYLALGNGGIEIIDISDPALPISRGVLANIGQVRGIALSTGTVVIVADQALKVVDASDVTAPTLQGSVNIGPVKDVVVRDNYAYVAAYSTGYKVVDISDPTAPNVVAGEAVIAPRDVELSDNFAFFAEQLFPNVVAYVNIIEPDRAIFQGVIDLSPFGDFAGTGIALDSSYTYVTEESFFVAQDFKAEGTSRLFIAQYRLINDNLGVAPEVQITNYADQDVVVEGSSIVVEAVATDDVAVAAVNFFIDGELSLTDTTRRYQVPLTVPSDAESLILEVEALDLGGNLGSGTAVTLLIQADDDGDGLGNEAETEIHSTDPADADSDDDGINDGEEIAIGTNPNAIDSDEDGRSDSEEVDAGTDPLNPDVTAPQVSDVTPVNGSEDIPETTEVVVTFNEALSARSINNTSVALTKEGGSADGRVSLSDDGLSLTFKPIAILDDFTEYTVTVSAVRDSAGNPIATPFTSTFTTGNLVDEEPPTVTTFNPGRNNTDVPVNSIVSAVMSEPIDTTTITEESFYVVEGFSGERVPGGIEISDDGTVLSFVPAGAFAIGRRHTIYLTSAITDRFGNPLSFTGSNFTTRFTPDNDSPAVALFSFTEGQTGLPLNALLRVRFDEPVATSSRSEVKLVNHETNAVVDIDVLWEANQQVMVVDPVVLLTANTTYRIELGAIADLSGNLLPAALSRTFVSGDAEDTENGSVVSFSPFSGQQNVPVNTAIQYALSEPVDPVTLSSGRLYIWDSTLNREVKGTVTVSADGLTVTFVPDEDFEAFHRIYAYFVYNDYPEDYAGNRFNSRSFNFVTSAQRDELAATLIYQTIAADATDVPVNGAVRWQFDDVLNATCVSRATATVTGGESAVTGSLQLSNDMRTVTFTPDEDFAVSTAYTVTVSGLCDLLGNALGDVTTNFTTSDIEDGDTTRPSVVVTPANNATDVAVDTPIVFDFTEAIDQSSVNSSVVYAYVNNSGTRLAGTLSFNSATQLQFTPAQPYPGDRQVRVIVSGVRDIAGNTNNYSSTLFTTVDQADTTAPTVSMVTPMDGSVDVARTQPVSILFSESMDPNTLNNDTLALFADGVPLSSSVSRSQDNRTVTFNVSLPEGKAVAVIATTDIQDLSGNRLAQDWISVFTTAAGNETQRPTVASVFPSNGSSNVNQNSAITLYFSEAMTLESIANAFYVSQNGVRVGGMLEILGNGQAITFTPDLRWNDGALVEVFVTDEASDLDGNNLNNFNSYFRVVDDNDEGGPTLIATQPAFASRGLPTNPVIEILFHEAIDPATVTAESVTMTDNNGDAVAITLSTVFDDQVIRIVPNAPLAANSFHRYNVTNSVTDVDGNAFSGLSYYFYTAEEAVEDTQAPTVLSMSPPDAAIDVGINAQRHLRFDEPISPISFRAEQQTEASHSLFFDANNTSVRLVPHLPLSASSEVTDTISNVSDYAGNANVERSATYQTQAGPDTTRPERVDSSPFNGADDVPLSPVIKLVANEALDPASITQDTVYLYDGNVGQLVSDITLSEDGKIITLVPQTALAVGRSHNFYASGIRDVSGNQAFFSSSRFTTGFDADTTAPAVTLASFVDGQTGIAVNTRIRVAFSEPISHLSEGLITLTLNGDAVPSSYSWDNTHSVLTLTPMALLNTTTSYVLNIGLAQDLAGNPLPTAQTISFTTGDSVDLLSPSVSRFTPENSATNVPVNTEIAVEFDQAIDPVTITSRTFYIYDNDAGDAVEGTLTVAADGLRATFVPDAPLQPYHRYSVYVNYNDSVYDLAGNRVSSRSYSFVTAPVTDATAPTVSHLNLVDGMTDVPVNANLRIKLDEQVGRLCVNNSSVVVSVGGVNVEGRVMLANDGMTISFITENNLTANTTYSVAISGLCDYAGNAIAAVSTSFTTAATTDEDTTRPTVTISPANSSTDVAVNSDIVFTFSETIDQGSVSGNDVDVYVNNTGARIAGTLSTTATTVTFTPSQVYPGNTQIFAGINRVLDTVGNSSQYASTRFTTVDQADATAPTVVATTPADSAMDVDTATPVTVLFSESMNPNSITTENIAMFANGSRINSSVSRSGDNRTITLNGNLPEASVVSVVLTSGVTDLSSNPLVDTIYTFTTGADDERTRPRVNSTYPANGASNIPLDAGIVVYFSETMNADLLTGAFNVSQNGQLVAGTATIIGENQALTFTPDAPFERDALIQIFVEDSAEDTAGNALYNYVGYFRTITDTSERSAFVTATQPTWNQTLAMTNPVIEVLYDKPLNGDTVSAETVTMTDSEGANVAVTVSLVGEQVIRLVPQSALVVSSTYRYQISSTVLDTDGLGVNPINYLFNTSEDAAEDTQSPAVTVMSPPSGTSGVAINAQRHMRFDESINPIQAQVIEAGGTVFLSEDNKDLRIVLNQPLTANSEVTDTVSAYLDYAGNTVVAASATYNTSGVPDTTIPTSVDVVPFNGATGVPLNVVMKHVASEPLDPASVLTGGVYLYDRVDNVTVPTTVSLSDGNTVISLVPAEALTADRSYSFFTSSIRDIAGNSTSLRGVTFTTGADEDTSAPTVSAFSVVDGASGIARNARLAVRFSEPMSNLAQNSVTLSDGSANVAVNYSWDNAHQQLLLTPQQLLAPSTTYTLQVSGAEDLSGNAIESATSVSFTTASSADLVRPTLTSITPDNNATGVAADTVVTLVFDEALDATWVNSDNLYLWDVTAGEKVSATLSMSNGNATVVLTPSASLQAGRRYDVYVGYGNGVYDNARNQFSARRYIFTVAN
ncbi:Ig-like domain-containing protein [Thaumasiovibrio subtropicus]|uniref:Ig-like domain-containing protein n=1 Tax=Thaumasiovibrio subtropicus TaxID=1891207 RepID=UPI000B4E1DB5|nr:Ig-like domain-containing protein [Thaumasiovibrio subtropicus]